MKNILLGGLILIGLMSAANTALARDHYYSPVHVSCNRGQVYYAGNSINHSFARPTFVDKMIISAEGRWGYAEANVYADGEWVARLGVPGHDPDYPVVIRKSVTSIVISFNGSIRVHDVRIFASETGFGSVGLGNNYDIATPAGMGEALLQAVAVLQETSSDYDFQTYLKPMRKAGLRLTASGAGRSYLSTMTLDKARVVIKAINGAEPFLDRLQDSDYYTPVVEQLYEIRERLSSNYEISQNQ